MRVALPGGLLVVIRVLAAVFTYVAVFDATALVMYAIGVAIVPDEARGTFGLIGLGIAEAAALATVLVFWRVMDRRRLRGLGLNPELAKRQWLRGAGVSALMMGFIVLAWYTLVDGATWDVNTDALRAAAVVSSGLAGFVVQGAAEELLFRGYVLTNLQEQWGLRWAVALSAAGFALWHAMNPAFNALALINLVLFGIATALYKVRVDHGQLWGVCAIHTVWNWLQQIVFGLPNSGLTTPRDDVLFSVMPNASLPDPIWGGGFGPEGTLAASLVLLALIGVTLRQPARRG
ncbi:MAG: CPBP family intramembrane metalloprotease [Chloroflexi bacterium]|nr:MAG: CPBP family intramembrane metalloprotease [Chloroflexota bacterium]